MACYVLVAVKGLLHFLKETWNSSFRKLLFKTLVLYRLRWVTKRPWFFGVITRRLQWILLHFDRNQKVFQDCRFFDLISSQRSLKNTKILKMMNEEGAMFWLLVFCRCNFFLFAKAAWKMVIASLTRTRSLKALLFSNYISETPMYYIFCSCCWCRDVLFSVLIQITMGKFFPQ